MGPSVIGRKNEMRPRHPDSLPTLDIPFAGLGDVLRATAKIWMTRSIHSCAQMTGPVALLAIS